jgi:Icc protein
MSETSPAGDSYEDGVSRRGFLKCMTWAGTALLWTVSGGLSRSFGLGSAQAAESLAAPFTFLQISDSHVGFSKPANPDALARCCQSMRTSLR